LLELGIDLDEDLLVISREIAGTGRSVVRINGRITPLAVLKKVSGMLMDIHGQHEHQSLLNHQNHIKILDEFGSPTIKKETMNTHFTEFKSLKKELSEITVDSKDFERKIDLLEFQINEIDELALNQEKDQQLEEEYEFLKNAETISESLSKSYGMLNEESYGNSIKEQIQSLASEMEYPAQYNESYKELHGRIQDVLFQLDDIAIDLRVYKDEISLDYEQLDFVEKRIDAINNLKRKYGNTIAEIIEFNTSLKEELLILENSKERVNDLQSLINQAKGLYLEEAKTVSEARGKVASTLASSIATELSELNMGKAQFEIDIKTLSNDEEPSISKDGFDRVEFMISTNPGKQPGKLTKVASGGEISRIMLALKVITAEIDNIGTMIFDEIDTGISGKTASIVGNKLKFLSESHQIICITHLPQIASKGNAHFLIQKNDAIANTMTTITKLTHEERVKEIARLLSGEEVSEISLANAEELLIRNKSS